MPNIFTEEVGDFNCYSFTLKSVKIADVKKSLDDELITLHEDGDDLFVTISGDESDKKKLVSFISRVEASRSK